MCSNRTAFVSRIDFNLKLEFENFISEIAFTFKFKFKFNFQTPFYIIVYDSNIKTMIWYMMHDEFKSQ